MIVEFISFYIILNIVYISLFAKPVIHDILDDGFLVKHLVYIICFLPSFVIISIIILVVFFFESIGFKKFWNKKLF